MNNLETNIITLLGGEKGLNFLLGQFYLEVLSDTNLSPFFRNSSVDKIIKHQRDLITHVLGGEEYAVEYTGGDLKEVHSDLKIKNTHVDIMLEKLKIAMENCGYDEHVIEKIVIYYDSYRQSVLTPLYDG